MKHKILILAAGVPYNLLQPLPGVPSVSTFPEYISKIIPFILGLAAVLATVMIIWGGIEYAVSLSEEGKTRAKDRITQAIFGLLLALASWLILWTINPKLVDLELTIPGLPSPSGQQILACTPERQQLCAEMAPPRKCEIHQGNDPVLKGKPVCVQNSSQNIILPPK